MTCQECGAVLVASSSLRVRCAACRNDLRAGRLRLRDQIRQNRALRAKVHEQAERSRCLNLRIAVQLARIRRGLAEPTRALKILVVDDEPAVLDSIRLLLEDPAARVLTARDGQEALVLAERHLPDLVLTDLRMPRLDGWELVRRLRWSPRTRLIVIIAMSAFVPPQDEVRLHEAGFDGWLPKPFHPDELRGFLAAARRRLIA
jgi:two-component system cell cycle response regulator DivK